MTWKNNNDIDNSYNSDDNNNNNIDNNISIYLCTQLLTLLKGTVKPRGYTSFGTQMFGIQVISAPSHFSTKPFGPRYFSAPVDFGLKPFHHQDISSPNH